MVNRNTIVKYFKGMPDEMIEKQQKTLLHLESEILRDMQEVKLSIKESIIWTLLSILLFIATWMILPDILSEDNIELSNAILYITLTIGAASTAMWSISTLVEMPKLIELTKAHNKVKEYLNTYTIKEMKEVDNG